MANKLTICGDLSASGSIYGTLDGGVNSNCGTANTWSGSNAFNSVAAGATYNTGYGYRALCSLTTGDCNTAFGASALQSTTSGNYNTGYGMTALYSNTTGIKNTAVGDANVENNCVRPLEVLCQLNGSLVKCIIGKPDKEQDNYVSGNGNIIRAQKINRFKNQSY